MPDMLNVDPHPEGRDLDPVHPDRAPPVREIDFILVGSCLALAVAGGLAALVFALIYGGV